MREHFAIRKTTVAYLILVIAGAFGLWRLEQTVNRVDALVVANRESICAFVSDLQGRYERTNRYLTEVVQGETALIPGVTFSQLAREQEARAKTIRAFASLNCQLSKEE